VSDHDILHQLIVDVGADTALRLMGIFKQDVDKRLGALNRYLQNDSSVEELHRHAHSLKGLCDTYGAKMGGDAAKALQEACNHGDIEDIRTKVQAALDIIPNDAEATTQTLKGIIAAKV